MKTTSLFLGLTLLMISVFFTSCSKEIETSVKEQNIVKQNSVIPDPLPKLGGDFKYVTGLGLENIDSSLNTANLTKAGVLAPDMIGFHI